MDLSWTLFWFALLVGTVLAVISLALIPVLFVPVIFPLFKLYGESAHIAMALAVMYFACTPFHASSISAITGVLRSGGDVIYSTILDVAPLWLAGVTCTALTALVLKTGIWPIAFCIQLENLVKFPFCVYRIGSGKWINDVTEGGAA